MLKKGTISRRLCEHLTERADKLFIEDVRIGLGYVGIALNNESMGLAAILRSGLKSGCSLLREAGMLSGNRASAILNMLIEGENPLEKAVGLAAANAVIAPESQEVEQDTIELMNLTPRDRVAMVGYFRPLATEIREKGIKLSVIEKNSERADILSEQDRRRALKECTVAIITATAILNNTIEEVLNGLDSPRHVAIIGPSTPLCREVFADTPVTHLGGSVVIDKEKIMQIISEAGGTPAMRPYLRFANIFL